MLSSRAKNLIRYVVPTIMSSVCFFLFTIIDGIFVGRGVGTNALGAINLASPFVMVISAMFMLTSIGGVTITAIRLGRHDTEGANQAFMHAVVSMLVTSIMLFVIGVFFTDPLCVLLGANDTFHPMVKDYLFWYSAFVIPSAFAIVLQGFCRNDGSPILVSMSVVVGTACNIFGDWLLIFPFQMGVKGAAIATGVSQTVGMLIVLPHFLQRKGRLYFHKPKLERALFKKIIVRGLPESISQLATPVMTLCMNIVLTRRIGDIGVNAFSIITYVATFSMAIFYGTSEGLQPLIGQSYGLKDEKSLKYYFHMGMLINFIGSIVINVVLLLTRNNICMLFDLDPDTLQLTVNAIPQFVWGFSVMSLTLMISTYLYSTKRSVQALIINVLRSLVIDSGIILLLPVIFGDGIIWHTFGIYETLVLMIAVFLLKRSERNGVVYC